MGVGYALNAHGLLDCAAIQESVGVGAFWMSCMRCPDALPRQGGRFPQNAHFCP